MLPSILARQVRYGIEDQLRASFAPTTKAFRNLMEGFLGKPETLLKGPWLSLDMPFRRSTRPGEFFPAIPLGFQPYRHQERAFERLSGERPSSTLVATGTGSGKTECFLLPVLDACRRVRSEPGIKAIFIYPMNALATDQARRIAKLVAANPAIRGLRVGIYADERPAKPLSVMTEQGVIDSREALVRNPPDILLTNYKMLDYMLVRPDEREIWTRNRPETLRYLVVDELHTFDGAQGTDLASLVRRLKARLDMRRGNLCCVGTSATLGGPEAVGELVSYATEIFDEPFDDGSIVLEDRQSVMEYLQPIQIDHLHVPAADDIRAITDEVDDLSPNELVRRSAELWFEQDTPGDLKQVSARIALGGMIDGHVFFQTLLKVLDGRPATYGEIRERLRENRLYRTLDDAHLDALLDTLAALVAHARRTYPDAFIGADDPLPLPFFNVRYQTWLRELRRMVATVEAEPRLLHHDDLGLEEQRRTLPVVHCRSCGGAGWAAVAPNDERRAICTEPKDLYQAYFGFSDRLRFVFREAPVPRTKRRVVGQTVQAWLCTRCLVPQAGETPPETGCRSCRAGSDAMIEVFIHQPGRLSDERFRVDHDCPFCGSPSGMGILGAQSVTLVSGMIATLFGSDHNDDPKLLTFSDSVQDAAHRAGVFQSRNARNVFRAGLSRFVCDEVDPNLAHLQERAPAAMRAALGPAKDDADFVATYLPFDMEWRRDYKELLAQDALPDRSALPKYLADRLSWEVFSELTFWSRMGATLERTGLVAPHVEPLSAEDVADEFALRMGDELAIDPDLVERENVLHFVLGVLDHMRARGAVVTDVTRMFVEREASWFAVMKAHPNGRSLPSYAPAAPKPSFPSNRILRGFEPFVTDGLGGWYVPWFRCCFDRALTLTGDRYREAYDLLFAVLERRGLAERISIGSGKYAAASAAWGLRPEKVRVYSHTALVRCNTCGNEHRIPDVVRRQWHAMPCTRVGCEGRLAPASDADRARFRTRILTKGRIKRVRSAEHTSLLRKEERLRVEEHFMTGTPRSWYPNLLAATPTLEMGINIGDLSTLVLCSVPPAQQNYVQRIGRTGRRDGNSLNVTVATARAHDMWYWADPREMIAGRVRTPGVHLKAVAILRRQFAAYTLDSWVAEAGAGAKGYGRLGDALKAIETGNRAAFPLFWFDYVDQKGQELFEGFCSLFSKVREDTEALEALRAFALGGEKEGLAHLVASEFADARHEITSVQQRISVCVKMEDKLRAMVPAPLDLDEKLKALRAEKAALGRIRTMLRKSDTLGYLTDRGVLPNYAFPEQGVTLKSVLYQTDAVTDEEKQPVVTEYMRPAAAALADFAPNAVFYADGKKLKIDQVDLSASPVEHWRVCPDCTHIAMAQEEVTDAPCPSCGSVMWADTGSRTPMIRLKQVMAVGSDRSSRIGDDGDERERRFFDRDYLPAFEKDQVGDAFAVEDGVLPFAYEHLRRCTFREVNFGETGDTPSGQKIAGQRRHGQGFSICRSCGKVQDPREARRRHGEGSKLGLHSPRCSENASEEKATYVSVVYLYREFSSEAIRMLLPIASSRDEDAVKSLRAAIDLGLRLHFKGKVDHLRSSLVENKEGALVRRHLYVYDTVPGGTGYLKQLATRPNEFRDVFAGALAHMRECVCNSDPEKDGCPRCIRSHAATFGKGEISRDLASRLLAEILSGWDGLRRIGSVNEIKLNKALESELEAIFIKRFSDAVLGAGGKFTKAVVSGRPGHAVTLGNGQWRLEQQVELHKRYPDVPATRADFVLWPAIPDPEAKPVAIYLDGWEWHKDRVPEDLALRQRLIRSAHVHVWSLTWDDVARAADAAGPDHFWNPLPLLPASMLEKLVDGAERTGDLTSVLALAPFDQFIRYVREADPNRWRMRADGLSMSAFLAGMVAAKEATLDVVVEALAGTEGLGTLHYGGLRRGILATPGMGCLAASVSSDWKPPAWPKRDQLVGVAGFDHRTLKSANAKKSWNGGLRLLNLLQFASAPYVGCAGGIDLGPARHVAGPAPGDAYAAAWDEVEALVLSDLLPLVRKLREVRPSVEPPEALYEVVGAGGTVAGTLELAWPTQKRGIVLDPAVAGLFPGWIVTVYTGPESFDGSEMEQAA